MVDKDKIVKAIRQAGIVGAGGAGFPTYVKLNASVEFLLINGAECEPLLAVDQLLMEKYAPELVKTAEILRQVTGARTAIFCLKQKYETARLVLEVSVRHYKNLKLHLLEDIYPAGDEQVMVYETLGRIVPEGGIPLQVGAVVINVETLFNVHQALEKNEPVTHTYVTITGDVAQPRTLRVPLGLRFRELVKFFGSNLSEETHILIEGGPLMGKVIKDWDLPIVKTTKGLIVARKDSYLAQRYTNLTREIGRNVVSICCDCQQCTELCPRYLLGHSIEPHRLMVAVAQGINREARIFQQAQFCCECGVCELYSCFMNLAPRSLNAEIKKELARRGIKSQPFKERFRIHPLRTARCLPTKRIKARLDLSKWERQITQIEDFPENELRELVLPLRQHIGAMCKPLVKRKDKVKKGMVVADVTSASLGVPLHSPVNGVISEINDDKIIIQVRNN